MEYVPWGSLGQGDQPRPVAVGRSGGREDPRAGHHRAAEVSVPGMTLIVAS